MSEKVTGNKQQDLAALKAYYEALRASKQEKREVEELQTASPKGQTKELGEKLLEQPYAKINFVSSQGVVSKEDASDLQELFEMAGISKNRVPSKAVYERIGKAVGEVSKVITDIETENHAEALFNSKEFKTLDDIFFS